MLNQKPLFNPKGDREVEKRRIIKGNPTNLFELNNVKYKWAYDFYKIMAFDNYWIPQEIPMNNDRKQYEELSKEEREAYDKVLSFLVFLDSLQTNNLPHFADFITAPEVVMALTAQDFQEALHSFSYAYIIDSVTDPLGRDRIYNLWRDDEILFERNKLIADEYQRFIDEPSEENFIRALFANYILEAIYFYSGFAFFYSLGRQGKMLGTVQEIRYINRDELCFTPGTEVLTNEGFKDFRELKGNEKIAQYDLETGEITFTSLWAYVEREWDGKVVTLKHEKSGWSITATEGHDMVIRSAKTNKQRKEKIENINFHPYNLIPVAGVRKKGSKKRLTPLERLLIALQADGTIDKERNGKFTGYQQLHFYFKRERKIERFEKILKELEKEGFKWKRYEDNRGGYRYTIYWPNDLEIKPSKDFDWINLEEITTEWVEDFVNELKEWDGHKREDVERHDVIYFSSVNEKVIKKIQEVCALGGFRTVVSQQIKRENDKEYLILRIWIYKDVDYINTQSMEKEEKHYKGKVYCVSVPKGNIIVKQGNSVCVAGNCHVQLFQHIISTVRKENPELFNEEINELVYKLFEKAVKQEIKWGQYVTKNKIVGLNNDIIDQYIKYLGNLRLKQIGLEPLWPEVKKHPMQWIEEFRKINTTKTDFFQARPATYTKTSNLKW